MRREATPIVGVCFCLSLIKLSSFSSGDASNLSFSTTIMSDTACAAPASRFFAVHAELLGEGGNRVGTRFVNLEPAATAPRPSNFEPTKPQLAPMMNKGVYVDTRARNEKPLKFPSLGAKLPSTDKSASSRIRQARPIEPPGTGRMLMVRRACSAEHSQP